MKYISAAAALGLGLLVTACASNEPEQVADNTPAPVYTPEPQPVDQGPVPGSIADFQETAGDRVFYALDRADLSSEARNVLREQAAWLNAYPQTRILIAGNADERGTREYNLALGQRRANAAMTFLVSNGVDASRISIVSYGKERPTCRESTERCWAVNRNATTIIQSGANS